MAKSIMELTDEILGSDLRMDPDETNPEELPEISDEDRTSLLNESMSESGPIPVDPDARKQHTAHGMSKNTLGRKKPTKTMGTPPGFEKTPEEKAAAKKAENASLYPRITLKDESRQYRGRDAAGRVKDVEGNFGSRSGTPSTPSPEAAAQGQARHDQRKADLKKSMAASNAKRREERARRSTIGSRQGPVKTDKPEPGSAGSPENPVTSNLARDGRLVIEKKKKDDDWIQGAEEDIERRGTEGKCTPITRKGCTGKAKALAKTFKKMGKKKDDETKSKKEKKAENASISREQYAVLKEALSILKEVTSVGSVGMGGSANKCYDADAKPMGKDTPPIKGVDSSLKKMNRKGGKKKVVGKKGSKGKKMENSSFSKFLDTVISETLEG